MNILTANFKHLYQKRSMFIMYAVFVLMGAPVIAFMLDEERCVGSFGAVCLWMFVFAMYTASLPLEILTKPFSFVLPGHERVVRLMVFSIGGLICLIWAVLFLMHRDVSIVNGVFFAVFALALMVFFAGAWIVFRFARWNNFLGLFPLLMFGGAFLDLHLPIYFAVTKFPWAVTALGAAVSYAAWRYWGREGLSRRYCDRLWMSGFDAWDKRKVYAVHQERIDRKGAQLPLEPTAVDRFFLGRISSSSADGYAKCLWGAFYKIYGAVQTRKNEWIRAVVLYFVLICIIGYFGPGRNIIFLISGIFVASMPLDVHTHMLTAGGRRQRLVSAVTLGVVTSVLITAAITAVASLTLPLSRVMPVLEVKGASLEYYPLDLRLFFIPLFMNPIVLTFSLILRKRQYLSTFFSMVLMIVLFQFVIFLPDTAARFSGRAVFVFPAVAGAWAVFISVVGYITKRRCLGVEV